jgi:hypothetical protein
LGGLPAGFGNDLQTVPMGIGNRGKQKHRVTSMSKDIETFRERTPNTFATDNKKADVTEHPKVFGRVGLLVNEPPGKAGLLFI